MTSINYDINSTKKSLLVGPRQHRDGLHAAREHSRVVILEHRGHCIVGRSFLGARLLHAHVDQLARLLVAGTLNLVATLHIVEIEPYRDLHILRDPVDRRDVEPNLAALCPFVFHLSMRRH